MYILCTNPLNKRWIFFLVLGTVAINCGFSANLAENLQVKATGIGNHPNFLDLPETTLSNIGREDLQDTTLSTIGEVLQVQ